MQLSNYLESKGETLISIEGLENQCLNVFKPIKYSLKEYSQDIKDDEYKKRNKQLKKNNEVPLVFVSYSYDGPVHKQWVNKLVCNLVDANVAVIYDQWDIIHGGLLSKFMERAIKKADRVICVLSPKYRNKAKGHMCGVKKEYSVISEKIIKNKNTIKYIPIIKRGKENKAMLPKFQGRGYIDFRCRKMYESSLSILVEDIITNTRVKKR